MRQFLKGKKIIRLLFAFVCLFQLGICAFYISQKNFLSCNEILSYGISNSRTGLIMDFPLNEWHDKDFIEEYLTPGEYAFDYPIFFYDNSIDMPPSLYYTILHTLSSFHPDRFSLWDGLGLNLILLLGSMAVLYFLSFDLFENHICALFISVGYGLTCGALNTMLLSETYMLLTFVLLAHLITYIKCFEQPVVNKKAYFFLGITLITGVLTHYYFLIVAVFFWIWYLIKFLRQKRWGEIANYLTTIFVFLLVGVRLFSNMWGQFLFEFRKIHAKLLNFHLKEYLKNLLKMFGFISEQMFGGLLWFVILGIILLFILNLIKFPKQIIKNLSKIFPLVFSSIAYFLIVTCIAPSINARHMMPLYPITMSLMAGLIYWLIKNLIKKDNWAILLGVLVCVVMCIPTITGKKPVNVFSDKRPHVELMEKYKDLKAVYIDREFYWQEYYEIIPLLKELDSYYVISYAQIVQWEIEDDLKRTYGDDETIVFVGNSALDEEITAYIKDTVRADEMILLDEYERWKIYRAVRDQQ